MKRLFDLLLVLLVLPLVLILGLIVAGMSVFCLGRPVFFTQIRPGKNRKPFELVKFRTMHTIFDQKGMALPDEQRLSRYGQFLRASSLDELPELWNVLKGDMSLVGPRPLLMEYLPLYTPEQDRRHEVRPGLTGWAQVNGRNLLSWEEKFALDVWYVENQSLWLDIKILCLTLWQVIRRDGINAEGEATMSKFTGSRSDDS